MKKRNYSTVEELLLADGFLNWYYLTDEKEIHGWNEWIATNPEHKHLADQAVEVLLLLRSAKENKITEQEIRAETNRLIGAIRDIKAGIINVNGEW
jgi:transmembrane sensor